MLLAGCRLLLPLLSKAARDGRARSSDCLDPATGGEAAGAGSSVWGEQAVAQEPGLAPPWGPPLKLAGNPHTAGTERRRETQVDSVLPTDTLFKENSLDNAWQIMNEGRRETSGPRPVLPCSLLLPPEPCWAGDGAAEGGGRLPFVWFLTFNTHHAVLKTPSTATGGALTGGARPRLAYSPAPGETAEADRTPGFHG